MNHSILVSASALRPRWLQWGVGLACAAVLAGCATMSDQAQGPEDTVNKRSAAYLKARQAGELDAAYAYLTPSYRALKTKERFRLENGVATTLKGGERLSTNCDPERCVIRRNFTATAPSMPGVDVPISITEAWVLEDGQWWLFLD